MTSQIAEALPRLGRQAVHDEQAAAAAEQDATGHTNGTRNGRGRSGSVYAQHEHADADEHEREQRPDVGQVVGLARVADRATRAPRRCR